MSRCSISDETLFAFWDVMYLQLQNLSRASEFLTFRDSVEARASFLRIYKDYENDVAENYMQTHIDGLDRHKQVAILIISAIKADPVRVKVDLPDDRIFVWQTVVVACGLSYMLNQLNIVLRSRGYTGNAITEYSLPIAFSCDTDYLNILGRNILYIQKHDGWELNPVDLANTLFLLEYITLIKSNLDLTILKEV